MPEYFHCIRYDLLRLGPLLKALEDLHGFKGYKIDHDPGCDSSPYTVGVISPNKEHHQAIDDERFAFDLVVTPMKPGDTTDEEEAYERQYRAHDWAAKQKWGDDYKDNADYDYWSAEYSHLKRDVDPRWSSEWDK